MPCASKNVINTTRRSTRRKSRRAFFVAEPSKGPPRKMYIKVRQQDGHWRHGVVLTTNAWQCGSGIWKIRFTDSGSVVYFDPNLARKQDFSISHRRPTPPPPVNLTTLTSRPVADQHNFRKELRQEFNDTCILTGISMPQLLKAAHIVPWRQSGFKRRVGLLLCSNAHDALDNGLIHPDQHGQWWIVKSAGKWPGRVQPVIPLVHMKGRKLLFKKAFRAWKDKYGYTDADLTPMK